MCKLVLNVGDVVRNINPRSGRRGWVGKVVNMDSISYHIEYQKQDVKEYSKENSHKYLEKLVNACHFQQTTAGADFGTAYRDVSMMTPEIRDNYMRAHISFSRLNVETKRRVLKKVRRNVLTGKTQEEHVKQNGYARGVQGFNTRALGKSTGQALHAIGSAMMNPGTEIRISGIDHHLIAQSNRNHAGSKTVDGFFRRLVQSLIGDMKGFTFTDTHIVFNPIVTEEIYVEY